MSKGETEIIDILSKYKQPIAVTEILENTSVNKTTVYRNLEKLINNGFVIEVNISTHKTHYELSAQAHHHHFVCKSCNSIEDFNESALEIAIKNFERVVSRKGFLIENHNLEFFGHCKNCL